MTDQGLNAPPSTWPGGMRVGLRTQGRWYGGGTLTIGPGVLTIEPSRMTAATPGARSATFRGTDVEILVARLLPPWINVSSPIAGDTGEVLVSVPIWQKRQLRQLFGRAGFVVTERRVWFTRNF